MDFTEGSVCDTCGRYGRATRMTISTRMALALIWLWHASRKSPRKWIDPEQAPDEVRGFSKLAYWGLVESDPWGAKWRLTPKGRAFVTDRGFVPEYAVAIRGAIQAIELSGDEIGIRDCLEGRYDYDALMDVAEAPK